MPIQSRARPEESGFTLIEIAIVGAILSVAAALSVPNFLQMYAKHELYQSTTSLYNRLILARSSAVSRNALIAATPTSVPMGLDTVAFTAPLGPETLPEKIRFITPLPVNPLGFTPRGLSTIPLATQTIQLRSTRDPNLIYSISLMPSGKVTWCRQAINPCLVNERS
ncbi:MAG: prepilin-type N-terminal cleavage/methylation domain-containing protein [Nitrospira sp.]|nr:prepilin-type N-terminal cleavage/methylation domain-containing protein [Nitrospira sp.]